MYNDNFGSKTGKGFPNPLAPAEEKASMVMDASMRRLLRISGEALMTETLCLRGATTPSKKNRKYANGTQDTVIYKKLLTSLDPNGNDDGSFELGLYSSSNTPKVFKHRSKQCLG